MNDANVNLMTVQAEIIENIVYIMRPHLWNTLRQSVSLLVSVITCINICVCLGTFVCLYA